MSDDVTTIDAVALVMSGKGAPAVEPENSREIMYQPAALLVLIHSLIQFPLRLLASTAPLVRCLLPRVNFSVVIQTTHSVKWLSQSSKPR